MNVSGILVVVPPDRVAGAVDTLNGLPGVEVHHTDPASGRIVVTQEAETVGAEVDGLKRIKALPHVILAEMVYHHFEESTEIIQELPSDLESEGAAPRVPSFLND